MEQCSIMAIDIQETVTERVAEVNAHGDQIVEILDWVDRGKNSHEDQKKMIKEKNVLLQLILEQGHFCRCRETSKKLTKQSVVRSCYYNSFQD